MEKDREPGTARFGNFINYYSFNPASRRIDLISSSILRQILKETTDKVLCLDIGCNSGELTEALYSHLRSVQQLCPTGDEYNSEKAPTDGSDWSCSKETRDIHILGIDIDPLLIERCRTHTEQPDYLTYQTGDIMSTAHRKEILEGFLSNLGSEKFTLITCFSVTLWIHLHHGDDGLKDFLKYICKITRHLLIEPQPYKCYKTAVRRMKRANCDAFPHFENLQWKQTVDQEIISFIVDNCDMTLVEILGETEWDRKICFFTANVR